MLEQIREPNKGEEIAVLNTNHGAIKLRLFEEAAPKTVENFKGLINKGYYNGIIFHRVIDNFMIQGGDPTGTGMGGESIFGKKFEDEINLNFRNFRGALSMANAGPNTNGSQFFIVQAGPVSEDVISQMRSAGPEKGYPDEIVDVYENLGGTFWLDGKHTVFGQVFEGMEVVDEIASLKVDFRDKPVEDVVIETAEIITF
ncbi:peptidylprolyl isomerase [Peptoniphilus indolicus]|uniref:Peptidyl-prolyl cis-trans isomerase n=2 Tax=Peptoniphilus indolicus TaxID=33030 RepID=G4D686_9FIRM|nr:peptidylprolyl isomerase [Peptoniphilus indolicus]EGY76664.1 peptidyl-prolyl cis-trans isomerase [Peptoniphilus indolicus ATCC 29427]SUB74486.1 Putative peptidyl-prolyl cis-trans isomerase [Peptoniphilus indolicus]